MIDEMTLENLEAKHLPFLYEIRFSVNENIAHPHQIKYLLREQALNDISQGGGVICKVNEIYAGYSLGFTYHTQSLEVYLLSQNINH